MYKSEIVRCNNHVVLLCQNQVLKQEHQNKDSIGTHTICCMSFQTMSESDQLSPILMVKLV